MRALRWARDCYVPPRGAALLLSFLSCIAAVACDRDPSTDGLSRGAPEPGVANASSMLLGARPADGARDVPVGVWPVLAFSPQMRVEGVSGIRLDCRGEPRPVRLFPIGEGRIALRPETQLPAAAVCTIRWRVDGRRGSVAFVTRDATREASAGEVSSSRLQVLYRRHSPEELAPVPDDFWTVADPETRTGRRLALPFLGSGDLGRIVDGLRSELDGLDGWSPIAPIVLPLSGAVAEDSLPRTVDDSLDPTATVALVDVDPSSPERGRRWPFELVLRHDRSSVGLESHSMWLLPALPLRPGGSYAVLIRDGMTDPEGRAMVAPLLLRGALRAGDRRLGGLGDAVRDVVSPAVVTAREALAIPWSEEELVFAMVFTVRSLEALSRDPLAMRADVAAMTGPRLRIDSVEPARDPHRPLAAIVRGHFRAPRWRPVDEVAFLRDEHGRPRPVGTQEIAFSLALPRSARRHPAPLMMYQHGNPGRAEDEIGAPIQDAFLAAGFAVAGFTDVWNRDPVLTGMEPRAAILAQMLSLTASIRLDGRVPDDWIEILGEQLAFIAALRELGDLDVLPAAAPDGRPEIDLRAPLVYEGISQGAIHGQALLAYAPEIRAASLVAGGARLTELLLHQAADSLIETLPILFGDLRPVDLWALVSLFQVAFDRQDAHLHALRVRSPSFRLPAVMPDSGPASGSRPRQRPGPSVLLIAGRGDRFVPNRASRSLAWVLGPLPWLNGPPTRGIGLPSASAPLRGNLADGATGAYVELVPAASGEAPTPGCVGNPTALLDELLREGHFCAQLAPESIEQRVTFLRSAVVEGDPVVIDPLAEGAVQTGQAGRTIHGDESRFSGSREGVEDGRSRTLGTSG